MKREVAPPWRIGQHLPRRKDLRVKIMGKRRDKRHRDRHRSVRLDPLAFDANNCLVAWIVGAGALTAAEIALGAVRAVVQNDAARAQHAQPRKRPNDNRNGCESGHRMYSIHPRRSRQMRRVHCALSALWLCPLNGLQGLWYAFTAVGSAIADRVIEWSAIADPTQLMYSSSKSMRKTCHPAFGAVNGYGLCENAWALDAIRKGKFPSRKRYLSEQIISNRSAAPLMGSVARWVRCSRSWASSRPGPRKVLRPGNRRLPEAGVRRFRE